MKNGLLAISEILTDFLGKEDDVVGIEMHSDMLFILSCLCDNDMHRKVCIQYNLVITS